jgi:Cache domain
MSRTTKDEHDGQPLGGVKIRSIAFFFAAIVSAIPLALYSMDSAKKAGEQAASAAMDKLSGLNQTAADGVRKWVYAQENAAQAVAQEPILAATETDHTVESQLVSIKGRMPGYMSWSTVGPDGNQINSSNPGEKVNVSESAYFSSVMRGSPSFLTTAIMGSSSKAALLVAVPIKAPGQENPTAVLTGLTDLRLITGPVFSQKSGETGISYIANTKGQVLAHPDEKLTGANAEPEVVALFASTEQERVQSVTSQGRALKLVARDAGAGLIVVTQMNQQEIDAIAKAARNKFLLLLGPFWALSLGLSLVAARMLSRKIERLAVVVNDLSNSTDAEEIRELEGEMKSIGGAFEVREMANAIGKLTPTFRAITARSQHNH